MSDRGGLKKLAPCPFCGGKAERNDKLTKGVEGVIECQSCGACAFASEWNRRALLFASREEEPGLRELLTAAELVAGHLALYIRGDVHAAEWGAAEDLERLRSALAVRPVEGEKK